MTQVVRIAGRAVLCLAMACLSNAAGAQTFPSKPVKLVIPFAPGGSTDVAGRLIAQKLSEVLGQPVIVENRTGAGGNIGMDYVAKSAPDGYTLGLGTTGTLAINPSLYPKMPYDPKTAFEPVSLVATGALTFVINANLPANNLREFIAYAKARPKGISLGSSGSGTPPHLVGVLFASAIVGTSGITLLRTGVVTARTLILPALACCNEVCTTSRT